MMTVTKDTFTAEVMNHNGYAFVDFYADWCAPCKMTSPILEELSKEMSDVKFVKVDVDANPELASQYSVFSIPTFLVVKNGKVLNQFSGAMGKEGFVSEIQKAKQ
jgi:thioredoxin 1